MKKIIALLWLVLILASCAGGSNSNDIINPESEFLYFYGASCPHCQELNGLVEDEDLFSKISVEKREVYFNSTNQELFTETVKALWINQSEVGVPFVLQRSTGEFAVWVQPALALFHSSPEYTGESNEWVNESNADEVDDVDQDLADEIINEIIPQEVQDEISGSGEVIIEEENANSN